MTGRPSKFTPELGRAIVQLVRRGHYKSTAAKACGIAESTLYEWIAIGDRETIETGEVNPDDHTKAELLDLASTRGVAVGSSWTKPRIAAALGTVTTPFSEFSEALREAEVAAEVFAVEAMIETGQKDWRFWRDYLARTRPERWGNVGTRPFDSEPDEDDMPAGSVDPGKALERAREIRLRVLEGGKPDSAAS